MKRDFFLWALLVIALVVLLAPYASTLPDGLEKVAQDKGFQHKAEGKETFGAPFREYRIPVLKNERMSVSAAGALGAAVILGLSVLLALVLRRRRR